MHRDSAISLTLRTWLPAQITRASQEQVDPLHVLRGRYDFFRAKQRLFMSYLSVSDLVILGISSIFFPFCTYKKTQRIRLYAYVWEFEAADLICADINGNRRRFVAFMRLQITYTSHTGLHYHTIYPSRAPWHLPMTAQHMQSRVRRRRRKPVFFGAKVKRSDFKA